MVRTRLGERLVKEGLITPAQLEMALKEQERTCELLGEIIYRLGFATKEAITKALAAEAGMEFVSLKEVTISENLKRLVSKEFARKHKVIPIGFSNGVLKIATPNIFAIKTIDELQNTTGHFVEVVATSEEELFQTLNHCYGNAISRVECGPAEGILEAEIEETIQKLEKEGDVGNTAEAGTAPPMVKLMDLLIAYAIQSEATDLHIEPEENLIRTRYRIDGVLQQGPALPKRLQSAITVRAKIMSGMNISETRIPQDGRIKTTVGDKIIDIRVNSFPTAFGETVAMRLLDKEKLIRGLESLGFSPTNLEKFEEAISNPYGIILVTGPTGSGKTTTLYSALACLSSLERKIITVEDPIEYELPIIRQSQVNPKAGFTFAAGLRAILRQDPNIIFVGEIRDGETADIAVQSALTGHLVFSTLHTNDAVGAIPRLLDLGVEPFLVASALISVLAQRLVRVICKQCKEEISPDPLRLKNLGWDGQLTTCYKGKGCPACRNTGHKGRVGLYELLTVTPELSELIEKRANNNTIRSLALNQGMKTLKDDGLEKVKLGVTTLEEVQKVVMRRS
ncbi:MAG TPA: GspE/PulE family protein [Candidatus Tripitaka californicus]|uniref:GspE/PulE family protein n=1 Tax=Candidatus Tripitaka californicus TaxID=3367616 RepID=UPI0040251FC4